MSVQWSSAGQQWTEVCPYSELHVERPVQALVGEEAVAVVRLHDGRVHAVGALDPFSQANVLSRGLVGTRAGVPVLISPMYRQAFDLSSGQCLDDPSVSVPVHAVRVVDGWVQVAAPASPLAAAGPSRARDG